MKSIAHCRSIFAREMSAYFNSPIAYIFIIVFVVLNAGLYMSQFFLIGSADMRSFFFFMPVVLCVFVPAITMRLWAEERRGNTFEMLLTFPMETCQLVLGKFAAAFLFYALALAGTLLIPVMLAMVGKPDVGTVIGGYIGSILMGAFFLSVGIFVSGLSKDQIVSFIVAMIVCFLFYLIGMDFIAGVMDGWLPGVGTFLRDNFGMTPHFEGFQRGVIDNRDVLYFIVMTGVFLVLNMFSIEDRLRPGARIVFSVAVAVCVGLSMILNFLLADIPLGRYDLTEGKLYTVTETTKEILRSLKAPVTVKLYISPAEKMPTAFKSLERDIRDRLDELKIFSVGKLRYNVYHMEAVVPEAQEEGEEESPAGKLQQRGIRPFQVRSIEQDQMDIKLVYSAIAIAYKEKKEEILPGLTPQNLNHLEYELISRVYRMTMEKTPRVALVAPFTQRVVDPQMRALLAQFGQTAPDQYVEDKYKILAAALQYEGYELHRVRLTRESPLPEKTDTIIVVDPERLNDRQRYEINRFLHEGGSVIIAAQSHGYRYGQAGGMGIEISAEPKDININDFIRPWGVTLSEKMLMDEQSDTISISGTMAFGPFEVSVPVKAPMQILVTEEGMNQDVSIAGRLGPILYLWGSALDMDERKLGDSNLKKTVLLTSSKKSWLLPFKLGPLSPQDVKEPSDGAPHGSYPLAVLLEGQFPDVFQWQNRPAWPQEGAQAADPSVVQDTEKTPTITPRSGKLLVVGCSQMFQEDIIKNGGMLNFFTNAVDALTLGGELINIRSHRQVETRIRPLSSAKKLWYRFMTILAVPCVLIVAGSIRAIWRRKEKEEYLKLLPAKAM
jgi:ABC-type uncharacterized transport system involved in gliding motility auxiliary subunit/ABC-type transport system involved in multi-copper enzyme maturation permease subunit